MFHWGKKKDFAAFHGPIDPNAAISPEETATILRLAELVPLVPPRQILLLLRQNGNNTEACIEKLLGMQTQFEQEAAAEKRLLEESAAVARLSDSNQQMPPAAPQPIQVAPSAPHYEDEKLIAVKKVTEHLAALERTYEQSFEVMERKLKDLQVENEAQRAEIALLHQQLREKDDELKRVQKESKRPPPADKLADEVVKDVTQRFEEAYLSAFDEGREADELVRSFGQLLRRKLALEMLKGTGDISERDFVKLDDEPAPSRAVPHRPPVVPEPHFAQPRPQPYPHPQMLGVPVQFPYPPSAPAGQYPPGPGMYVRPPHAPMVYAGMMPVPQQHQQMVQHPHVQKQQSNPESQAF